MPDSNDELTYLCGGEIDAGEFSLKIDSDDLEPAVITGLLNYQPTRSHRRGESFGKHGRHYGFGRWCFSTGRLDFRSGKSFEEFFDDFVRNLPDDVTAWENIAANYEAKVFICLWMRTWNREFDISAFALGELSRRKLRVHIDTYLEDSDDDKAK